MRKRSAVKPRRMRKEPRGQNNKEKVLAPHQPSAHAHLPEVRYRRLWP